MTGKTHILITGSTGYIGGSFLASLLSHSKSETFQITALLRSEAKAHKLKSIGVKAVVGSNQDYDLLTQLSSEADIVFACTDADDLPCTEAILKGLKKAHESSGKVPSLIHTSGTGVLCDDAEGMYAYDTIYNDTDVKQIESLAPTQLHRNVDLAIVEADKQGYTKTYIVLPSTIYGIASTALVDMGVQNPRSKQIPALVDASLDRRQGGMVGKGENRWPNVSITDVNELFVIIFDAVLSSKAIGHGREGFYFGENGEHKLYDINKKISEHIVELAKVGTPEPTTFTDEECQKYFGGKYLGSNSRCRADRSRSIGWKPKDTTQSMLDSIKAEVIASMESK